MEPGEAIKDHYLFQSEMVGNFSKSKCINVCKEKTKLSYEINGVMVSKGADMGCWCLKYMKDYPESRGNDTNYESCMMRE